MQIGVCLVKSHIHIIATFFTVLVLGGTAEACPRPKERYKVCSENITVKGGRFVIEQARDRSEPNPNHVMKAGHAKAFTFLADNGHNAATYITMDLDKVGTKQMNGRTFGVYRLTDEIGLLIKAGDYNNVVEDMPHTVRNEERGRKTRVLPSENSSSEYIPQVADSLGFGIDVYPILLSPKSSGIIKFPGNTRIMTVSMKSLNNRVRGKTEFRVFAGPFSIEKRIRTCSLTSSRDVTLTFPTISKTSFPNVDSLVYGANTNISLACDPNVEVWATLSDVNQPNNRSATLSIEKGNGKANGIGIQLFKNEERKPLKYGAPSPEMNNPNSWKFADRNVYNRSAPSVKLTGYYVRTGNIKPGDVRAQATITFSYQ